MGDKKAETEEEARDRIEEEDAVTAAAVTAAAGTAPPRVINEAAFSAGAPLVPLP